MMAIIMPMMVMRAKARLQKAAMRAEGSLDRIYIIPTHQQIGKKNPQTNLRDERTMQTHVVQMPRKRFGMIDLCTRTKSRPKRPHLSSMGHCGFAVDEVRIGRRLEYRGMYEQQQLRVAVVALGQ